MERTCENCEYKYEWVDCIQCCDCSCHNRWKPNSELSNFAIEELEKIKENIQFIAEKCLPNNLAEEFEVKGLKTSIEIIDRQISKLKGENNGETTE